MHGGQASTVSNCTRQLGGVIGVAIVAVFVESRAAAHATDAQGVFLACAQVFLLLALSFALALAVRMQPRPARRSPPLS